MRFRRLNYRYAVVLTLNQPRPFGDPWRQAPVIAQPRWRPAADLSETPDSFHLTIELAGVDAESIDIVLYEDAVVVEGNRRLTSNGVYHAAEIRQGQFRLELPLPSLVDPDGVEGKLDRGLLSLQIAKAVQR